MANGLRHDSAFYSTIILDALASVAELIKRLHFIIAVGFGMHPLHAANPTARPQQERRSDSHNFTYECYH